VLTREIDTPFFGFLELGIHKPKALLIDYVLGCCESALSRFTDNAMLWCIKGKLLNGIGRTSDALECLARATTIKEDSRAAHFIKMEALRAEQEYESALDAIRICALHEPDEPLFMLREAEILCQLDETEKALEKIMQAIGRGLDLSELRVSVEKKRLDELREFDSFVAIVKDLETT
jgi:tetratricopeptide (TPR) repeat protein